MNKPFGKEPFAWRHDPQYQQQKLQKLEKLHQKILADELSQPSKDKYGNIVRKQINIDKQPSEDLVESKKKRFTDIMSRDIVEKGKERHPYEIMSTLQRCGNSVVQNIPGDPYLRKNTRQEEPQTDISSMKSVHSQKGSSRKKPQIIKPQIVSQERVPKPSVPRVPQVTKAKKQKNISMEQKASQFLYERYGGQMGPDSHLIDMLEREAHVKDLNVKMDDIADLQTAKNLLQEAVLLPLMLPDFFKGIRRPWKGVLLFGPPGTGKTLLAKAIASTGKTKFFNISASSLASKWRGESEKLVRLLFQMARFYAPSTVFIDEIDSIASRRTDNDDQASRKVKTQLLTQMDGVGSTSQKPVIVIAATNRPWDLDQALRRRLQKRIYIPLPTEKGRKILFQINTKNIKLDSDVDFQTLSKKTKGYSGADIVILIRSASFLPLRRYFMKKGGSGLTDTDIEKCKKEVDVPIKQADFLQALKNSNPSVGGNDLASYDKWMKQFGSV